MNENVAIKALLRRECLKDGEEKALSSLLTGEMAAVRAYDHAIDHVQDKLLVPGLKACRRSHLLRREMLKQRAREIGAQQLKTNNCWVNFTSFLEDAAFLLGDRVAMSVLAAGENYGLEQYDHLIGELDNDTYELARRTLFIDQKKTWHSMSNLCALAS